MFITRGWLAVTLLTMGTISVAQAATIFTEDFSSYTGTLYESQVDTGDATAYGGSVSGWTATGFNALHGVELSPGDWAAMIFQGSTLTLNSGLAANDAGVDYALTFDYGTGNYATEGQGTGASDGLTVEILRASDDSVLAEQTFMPGVWGSGNYDFEAGLQGTLNYTGDGTGDVLIQIIDSNPSDATFGGSIDNIALSSSSPEPAAFVLAGSGLVALGWFARRRRAA